MKNQAFSPYFRPRGVWDLCWPLNFSWATTSNPTTTKQYCIHFSFIIVNSHKMWLYSLNTVWPQIIYMVLQVIRYHKHVFSFLAYAALKHNMIIVLIGKTLLNHTNIFYHLHDKFLIFDHKISLTHCLIIKQ